jgi:hypothetical protein
MSDSRIIQLWSGFSTLFTLCFLIFNVSGGIKYPPGRFFAFFFKKTKKTPLADALIARGLSSVKALMP